MTTTIITTNTTRTTTIITTDTTTTTTCNATGSTNTNTTDNFIIVFSKNNDIAFKPIKFTYKYTFNLGDLNLFVE